MSLLGSDEPPAVECLPGPAGARVLLVCDHASPRVPAALHRLGLTQADLSRHIAVDIGAAALTRHVAAALGAPAVLAGYSRLVLDVNRPPGHPTAIPATSDTTAIPGNRDLSAADRQVREEVLFHPYHGAIVAELSRLSLTCEAPALISIHSFTPVFQGEIRPWQLGVLWDYDPRIAVPLMDALAADPDLCIGNNLPYSGRNETGYTATTHAQPAGRPHVMIEVRQDLLGDAAGVAHWADVLVAALRPILAEPALYHREVHRRTPAWRADHVT